MTTEHIQIILNKIDLNTIDVKRNYALMLLASTGGLCTIEISRADAVGIRIIGNSEVLYIYKEKIELKRMIILRLP